MGKIVTLSGRPGVGKSRAARELMARNFRLLKSVTTRPPRENGERKEAEYEHVSAWKFRKMVSRGEFLWHIKHKGARYGTKKKVIEEALLDEASYVAILTWEKAVELANHLKALGRANDICLIFLIAPKGVIWDRLVKRDGDTEQSRKNFLDSENWPHQAIFSGEPFRIVSTGELPSQTIEQIVRLAERF